MSYDAVQHARDQVAYALRVLDESREHYERVVRWAQDVMASLPAADPLRLEGEILFPHDGPPIRESET